MTSLWPQAEAAPLGSGLGWPDFAQRWLGGEYPAGRGQQRAPEPGWQCPGCSRCYAPGQIQCRFCGPAEEPGSTRDLTWTTDAAEPDES